MIISQIKSENISTLEYLHILESSNLEYIFDLQMFAAEDEGRTEEGSEKRRNEERDKGNVPKSSELPPALILVTTIAFLYLLGNFFFTRSYILFVKYFQTISQVSDFQTEEFNVRYNCRDESYC